MIRTLAVSIAFIYSCYCCISAQGQLASNHKSADELLQIALLEINELHDDYCVKFAGELSTVYQKDGTPLFSEIQGYSILSAKTKERYHSFLKIQVQPPSRPSDATVFEAIRFADPSKNIFVSSKNLPTTRKELQAKNIKSWTVMRNSPDKPVKWVWPELDPFGLIFATGNAWTISELGAFPTQLNLFQPARYIETELLKNGSVLGRWKSVNGKADIEIVFGKDSNFMPVVVRTKPADDPKARFFETKTTWKRSGEAFLPVVQRLSYFETGSFGQRDSQLDIKWIWLPEKVWQANRINFEELTKDNPENEVLPDIVKLFVENASTTIFQE